MESISVYCESRERDSICEGNSQLLEKVKTTDNDSANNATVSNTKESSCQTEIDEIFERQLTAFEDELEEEREEIEKEFNEEKASLEFRLKSEYNEIIKAKDEVIRVLTEEKDFLWSELRDLRKSFDLFTRHVHRDALMKLGREHEKELDTKGNDPSCCHGSSIGDSGELLTVLRKQEEILLESFVKEKAEMTIRFEREKVELQQIVQEECEEKYAFERAYLLQSIEGLKEGLDSLKIQKHELAKIFEGERNALELSFKRKEDELRQNLKLELQRKIIKTQKPWARTKI